MPRLGCGTGVGSSGVRDQVSLRVRQVLVFENLTWSVRGIECRNRFRSGHATYWFASTHREPHFAPLSEGVRCRKRQLCVNMSRVNF